MVLETHAHTAAASMNLSQGWGELMSLPLHMDAPGGSFSTRTAGICPHCLEGAKGMYHSAMSSLLAAAGLFHLPEPTQASAALWGPVELGAVAVQEL